MVLLVLKLYDCVKGLLHFLNWLNAVMVPLLFAEKWNFVCLWDVLVNKTAFSQLYAQHQCMQS